MNQQLSKGSNARSLWPQGMNALKVTLGIVGLIGLCEMVVRLLAVPAYILPTPSAIASVLVHNSSYYLHHVGVTTIEAVVGLLGASVFGIIVAVCISLKTGSERLALPLLVAIQAVPIVALAPVMILWFGPGLASKAAMAGLLCFFPMALNTIKGLRAVPPGAKDLIVIYDIPRFAAFRTVALPYALPFVMAGLRISASMAMIGAIVAEYAGANGGLGYLIMQSTYRVDTPSVFAAIVMSAFASWLFYGIIVICEHTALGRFTRGQ